MSLGLELNVGMKLEQKLSPQMIQSLKLLQVTALQLEAMITEELEVNPLLEKEDDNNSDNNSSDSEEKSQKDGEYEEINPEKNKEEVDWEAFFEDGFDPGYRQSEDVSHKDKFERVPVSGTTLQDFLRAQLQYKKINPQVRDIVEYLIDCLSDDGYLVLDVEDGGNLPPVEENPFFQEVHELIELKKNDFEVSKEVREAFHILRRLEPAGIGARNLQECLLLQMYRDGNCSELALLIVEKHFDLFKKLKISALAKELDKEAETIQTALREIGRFEPKPGRQVADSVSAPIIPDLLVEVIDGEIILLFNDRFAPSLRVSRNYSDLIRKGSKASADTKKFVRDKLNSASWLIRAIEQRKTTMLKVMRAIINSQPEFFSKGPTHLRPLILQDIAEKIGMHISTVSRVINGKYVQTPHGIFELKYFFTSGVAQEDGTDVSSIQIKEAIRKLVSEEDSHKPLSDQKIANLLKEKGLEVARRTVAKYRDQLEILPARLRKEF